MNALFFKDYMIAGGLMSLNDKNIELREIQIRDGLMIHTCNDYKNSLEVIKEASFNTKNKVKIISKVYFNYPDINHRRFRSLFSQLEEQRSRLGFIPLQWQLQLCCYCSINQLISKNAQKFFRRIKKEFGINKIFLEIYPVYNYENDKIQILNNFYKEEMIFGLIGYQNLMNRIFNEKQLIKYAQNSTQIIYIGILGKGIQNKSIPRNFNKDFIKHNIIYFLNNINNNKLIKGITNFSSKTQYENFYDLFINLEEEIKTNSIDNLSNSKIKGKIFYFEKYDQYGGCYSLKEYFFNPKLILSKIKNFILSKLKGRRFSNNYFG